MSRKVKLRPRAKLVNNTYKPRATDGRPKKKPISQLYNVQMAKSSRRTQDEESGS